MAITSSPLECCEGVVTIATHDNHGGGGSWEHDEDEEEEEQQRRVIMGEVLEVFLEEERERLEREFEEEKARIVAELEEEKARIASTSGPGSGPNAHSPSACVKATKLPKLCPARTTGLVP